MPSSIAYIFFTIANHTVFGNPCRSTIFSAMIIPSDFVITNKFDTFLFIDVEGPLNEPICIQFNFLCFRYYLGFADSFIQFLCHRMGIRAEFEVCPNLIHSFHQSPIIIMMIKQIIDAYINCSIC